MKRTVFGFHILMMVFFISCTNSQSADKEQTITSENAHINFEQVEHDFGTIPYEGDAEYDFVFKNTGNEPLVLQNVKSTCGCTVPQWPKEPIAPGESAKIKVKYNTRISGSFTKGITVYSNAENPTVQLRIKGEVERPAAKQM